MGSVAILPLTSRPITISELSKLRTMHPFFTPARPEASKPDQPNSDTKAVNSTESSICSFDGTVDEDVTESEEPHEDQGGRRRKRRKLEQVDTGEEPREKKARSGKRGKASLGGNIADHFIRLGGSAASSPKLVDQSSSRDVDSPGPRGDPALPLSQAPNSTLNADSSAQNAVQGDPNLPKKASNGTKQKILRLNRLTGTIGSPPKAKSFKVQAGKDSVPVRRSRTNPSTRVVFIKYGKDPESCKRLGDLIQKILDGSHRVIPPAVNRRGNEKRQHAQPTSSEAAPCTMKATHPFFQSQSRKTAATSSDGTISTNPLAPAPSPRNKQYSSTPCSPKRTRGTLLNAPVPTFGMKATTLKVPGAKLPAWPWQGMSHVRGDGAFPAPPREEHRVRFSLRKSKGNSVTIAPQDSVISRACAGMDLPGLVEEIRGADPNSFSRPPPELRLPQKHFESGPKLGQRVKWELRCIQPSTSTIQAMKWKTHPANASELVEYAEESNIAPPQLLQLYDMVQHSLSAFDKSQCEISCWMQKYAPSCAAEIIQPGREAFLLKHWLEGLMVQAVDTGASDVQKLKATSKTKVGLSERKNRKRKKLEGFVVSTDEEDSEMDVISDGEDGWTSIGSQGLVKKTVIRSGDRAGKGAKHGGRFTNAVVISGPHGCGKTAAVYAVARELDFEVFEINPGSRRTGKDVLERIGDMTRNHLVQHQGPNPKGDEEAAVDDEVARDIESGKQATMNAFFKPKPTTKPQARSKQPSKAPAAAPQVEVKKPTSKTQKQSLILLDEADILFEEDKQFWVTVISIIAQSKRPFVITCNDETLIPLQSLNLHAIFRFSKPQADLAIDRLILVAAGEGHALRRDAVEALYESRNGDLRASLMDLNFWCQIGVGDRRGGFEWFYPRWPKGVDLDEDKQVIRVISEGTYQSGMGWICRDTLGRDTTPEAAEEEILHQLWESWGMDIGQWQDSLDLDLWAKSQDTVVSTPIERLTALEVYDSFTANMSAADICSSGVFAVHNREQLDTSLPEWSQKIRDDYVVGRPLLEATPLVRQDGLCLAISSTLKCLARDWFQRTTGFSEQPYMSELGRLNESQAIRHIRKRCAEPGPSTPAISRLDFSLAFDPIAASDKALFPSGSQGSLPAFLDPSVFDRTMSVVALDVAPYVRGIVAYDTHLQTQRLRLSNLMSEGGRGPKKMRITRSAFSAMEGGSRSTTRGDRWFKADLNTVFVMRTAGRDWEIAVAEASPVGLEQPPPSKNGLWVSGMHKGKGPDRRKVLDESEDELAADEEDEDDD